MIFGKADARVKYTVWAKIKALSPPDRRRLVNDNGESNWLSLLTPTQYAQLFPDYYKKALPDIGKSPTSGAGGTWSGDTISGGQSKYSTYEGRDSRYTKSYGREGTAERTEDIKQSKPYDPVTALNQRLEKETGIRVPSETTSGYLAEKRAKYFDELDNNPKLKDEVMRAIRAENGKNATSMSEVLESMVNRSDAFGYGSLDHALHNGFYGPINRGDTAYTRPLTKEERDMGEEAIARVRGGQNNIEFRTDQGMLTDPGSRKYLAEPDQGGWIKRSGENYFYMGKKGRAWAEAQRKAEAEWQAKQKQEFGDASKNVNPNMEGPNRKGISPSMPEPGLRTGDALNIPPEDLNEAARKYFDKLTPKQRETFFKQYDKAGADKVNQWAKEAEKDPSGTPVGKIPTAISEDLREGNVRFFKGGGNIEGVNKKLLKTLQEASKDLPDGYYIRAVSGKDPRDKGTKNHPGGVAVDLKIYGPSGKELKYTGFGEGNKIYEQLAQSMYIRGKKMFPEAEWLHGGTWISDTAGYGDRMHYQIIDPDQPVAGASHAMKNYSFEKGVNPNFAYADQYMSPEELNAYRNKVQENMKREMDDASRNVNPEMNAQPVRPGISPDKPEPGLRGNKGPQPSEDDPFAGVNTYDMPIPKMKPEVRRFISQIDRKKLQAQIDKNYRDNERARSAASSMFTRGIVEQKIQEKFQEQYDKNNGVVPEDYKAPPAPQPEAPAGENNVKEPPPIDLGKDNPIVIQQGTKGLNSPSAAPAAPEPKATPVNPEPKPEAPKPESKGDNTPPPNKQSNLSTNNMPKVAAEMSNHSRVVPPSQERAMKQATLNNKDHFGHGSVNETA